MGKMKFYAVKSPSVQKIVTSWPECEKLSHGVKGVLFKSFSTREDAEAWLSGVSEKHPDGLRIYVDGSFAPGFDRAGWAFIAVENDIEIASESGVTDYPAESRNIDGELTASLRALAWLKRSGKDGVICHDYEGIARWAKGDWKASKPVAVRYREAVKAFPNAKFEKVEAHTGVKWNEAVDSRAKAAIEAAKRGKIPGQKSCAGSGQSSAQNSLRENPPAGENSPQSVLPKNAQSLGQKPDSSQKLPPKGASLDLFG